MGYPCTKKSKYQGWNGGFSFSLAWRETVSTALVYNYWRHCWQQNILCGLGADQRHHISLVSFTHAYTTPYIDLVQISDKRESLDISLCTQLWDIIELNMYFNNHFIKSQFQSHFWKSFGLIVLSSDFTFEFSWFSCRSWIMNKRNWLKINKCMCY